MTMTLTGSIAEGAPLAGCRRIAIVLPTWLGDTVMAGPALRAIRTSLPHARLIGIMRPGFDEVLDGSGWLDDAIPMVNRGLSGVIRAAKMLRSHAPDAVVLLPNSFRWGMSAFLAGAPRRIGYARDGRGLLLSHKARPQRRGVIATRVYYADLASFATAAPITDLSLELSLTAAQRDAAREALARVPRPFAMLVPGGNRPSKRWPPDRFARVAEMLATKHGMASIVSGTPEERDVLDQVVGASTAPIIDLSKRRLSLGTLKAVIAEAALVVTNDTGPRHLAAALGTPLVTLFGPTDHRWTTIGCQREAIVLAEPFLPEEMIADRHPEACRIDRIPLEDVTTVIDRVLKTTAVAT